MFVSSLLLKRCIPPIDKGLLQDDNLTTNNQFGRRELTLKVCELAVLAISEDYYIKRDMLFNCVM